MREICFENMNVKAHGGTNKPNFPDYEPNITKMRTCMRKHEYLSQPEKKSELRALGSNDLLNSKLLNLKKMAKKTENRKFINVIRFNDFEAGFTSGASIKVLKEDAADKLDTNFELQIKILIESEQ